MNYCMHIDPGNDDRSPLELAVLVREALLAQGVTAKVQYGDLDTIMWTMHQEKIEGIVYKGSGYGAPRHGEILRRAGYGNDPANIATTGPGGRLDEEGTVGDGTCPPLQVQFPVLTDPGAV